MLADSAHLQPELAGDRQTLGIERSEEPADGVGQVFVLAPGLAAFHAGQVAERDPQMVLRVEIADRDGKQIGAWHETFAKKRRAERHSTIRAPTPRRLDVHPPPE